MNQDARGRGNNGIRLLPLAMGGILLSLCMGASPVPHCPAGHVTQIESPLGCVNTVVTKSSAPTGPSMADGGSMSFRDDIASGQKIREIYVPPDENPVANAGDRVRVCFLSTPKKGGGCDPATDIRGREFLVYNSKSEDSSGNAAVYSNGEHWCGGA
jgi:hypothetical protein